MPENDKHRMKIVEVSVEDMIPFAQKQIIETYGGVGLNDIVRVSSLRFSIPDMEEEGKCNELFYSEYSEYQENNGCGETGGTCICGKEKGHEEEHECKLCGEMW